MPQTTSNTTAGVRNPAPTAEESKARSVGPEEPWTHSNSKELSVTFQEAADNTSQFTRDTLNTKVPMRYWDHKMTFEYAGTSGVYVRVNEVAVPYNPPPKAKAGTRVSPNKYGSEYVYAALPGALLEALTESADRSGFKVHGGDKLVSTAEDWWTTLSFSNTSSVLVKGPGKPKNVALSRIFSSTKLGVMCNLFLSFKLKAAIPEAVSEDTGNYYSWNDISPAMPDADTTWTISPTIISAFVTDVGIDCPLPQRVNAGQYSAPTPQTFVESETDVASKELLEELSKLGI